MAAHYSRARPRRPLIGAAFVQKATAERRGAVSQMARVLNYQCAKIAGAVLSAVVRRHYLKRPRRKDKHAVGRRLLARLMRTPASRPLFVYFAQNFLRRKNAFVGVDVGAGTLAEVREPQTTL